MASASVSPRCVARGSIAAISVKTPGWASVGYLAYYSNGENGAKPPYGSGYGGNSGATVKDNYSDKWLVAMDAPLGASYALVTIIYPTPDAKRETLKVPFKVAEPGGC